MRKTRLRPFAALLATAGLTAALVLGLGLPHAQAEEDAQPAPDKPAPQEPSKDGVAQAVEKVNQQDNGLTVNLEEKYVDLEAKVCLRSAEFLEMLACTPDSREHESLLVLEAEPSMIHVGLLLLGLEPGKPLHYDRAFDPPKLVPATGPEIGVYVVYKVAGREREVPANRWVNDSKNDEMMEGNTWLFAGSVTSDVEGKKVYLADINGSAISLVNFGDDLLTLPNKMTQANDSHGKVWVPRTDAIPKVGTEVRLRLRPVGENGNDAAPPDPEPAPKPDRDPSAEPEPESKPESEDETETEKPAEDPS